MNSDKDFFMVTELTDDVFFHYNLNNQVITFPLEIAKKFQLHKEYKLVDFVSKYVYKKDKMNVLKTFTTISSVPVKFRFVNDNKDIWYSLMLHQDINYGCFGVFKNIEKEVILQIENENLKIMNVMQNYLLKAPNQIDKNFELLNNLTAFFEADQIFVAVYRPQLKIKFTSNLNEQFLLSDQQLAVLDKNYFIKTGSVHIFNEIQEYPEIESFIEFPLFDKNENCIGILGVVNSKRDMIPDSMLNYLSSSLSAVMQTLLRNEELEKRSLYDLLTGVKNRNAYERYFKVLEEKKVSSLGVIVIDINGLKTCNDTEGHSAGDSLIKNVAHHLAKVFFKENVYRFGGDEFVIVLENITENELEEKIRFFQNDLGEDAVSLGYTFRDENINLKEMQNEADEAMYKDKKKFYKNHPEVPER